MRSITANAIQGTGVALVTPFDNSGAVDYQALEKLVQYVSKGGVEFLVVLGTTAESVTLSADEKRKVLQKVKDSNTQNLPIVLGLGGNNTAQVVAELQSLDSNGLSAILSVAPYYNKPTQAGIEAHFKAIIDASPIPVILYNVPGRTSSNISASTCLKLAAYSEKVIAVKEASGNMNQIMEVIDNAPEHFVVLSGDDNLTLAMLAMGANGVISVSGQLMPRTFSDMVREGIAGQMESARQKHYSLFELTNLLFEEGNPAGVKAGLELKGICEPSVRLPLIEASSELKEKIALIVSNWTD